MEQPLIAPASTRNEYYEEEPTVTGYSVSTNQKTSRRNDKSMNLSKLEELNQVRIRNRSNM